MPADFAASACLDPRELEATAGVLEFGAVEGTSAAVPVAKGLLPTVEETAEEVAVEPALSALVASGWASVLVSLLVSAVAASKEREVCLDFFGKSGAAEGFFVVLPDLRVGFLAGTAAISSSLVSTLSRSTSSSSF